MTRYCWRDSRWLAVVVLAGLVVPAVAQSQETIQASGILPSEPATSHPLDPAIAMARRSLKNIEDNVHDYTALFLKRCRVDGELPKMQYANLKIRNRKRHNGKTTTPMAVYLDFLKPASVKGREVIWAEGLHEEKLVVHEAGLRGMVNLHLDPNGFLAMRGQRYPITDIGIHNLNIKLIEIAVRDRKHQECKVNFFKNARVDSNECTMFEVIHPVKRPYFDFYRARVYFSDELNIPIRYESYSWPAEPDGEAVLEEEYTYLKVKTNVGLTDRDFDISNPEYRFQ